MLGCQIQRNSEDSDQYDDRYTDVTNKQDPGIHDGPIIEGYSLLGDGLVRPEFDSVSAYILYNDLEVAIKRYGDNPDNPETILWIARKTAAMWRFQDAVIILTNGIESYPNDPRFFRYRGHYLMTIREFDLARSDMERALKLIENKPDDFEPDFQDGTVLEPSSTLHFNIWLNYGLLEYFMGNFQVAASAFTHSLAIAGNPDTRLTAADWLYLSEIRSGNKNAAAAVLNLTSKDEPVETQVYSKRIRLYKNNLLPDDDFFGNLDPVEHITLSYGIAMHKKLNGDIAEYSRLLNQIIDTNIWAPFSYIAAEADLRRMQGNNL
jgi:tetratricopeptide (TPR) repeat protein